MNVTFSNKRRGFHDLYLRGDRGGVIKISESSAIGEYDDALDNPGSSALWIESPRNAYSREEIESMIEIMQKWLDQKRLPNAEQLEEMLDPDFDTVEEVV